MKKPPAVKEVVAGQSENKMKQKKKQQTISHDDERTTDTCTQMMDGTLSRWWYNDRE